MDNINEIAGWWGAIVATIVLIWDAIKWYLSGRPIIRVSVTANMKQCVNVLGGGGPKEQKYIGVNVTNTGARKTTLTQLFLVHYKNHIHKIINKQNELSICLEPLGGTIPHELEQGCQWVMGIVQTREIEEKSRKGILYVGIHHTYSKKGVYKKLNSIS